MTGAPYQFAPKFRAFGGPLRLSSPLSLSEGVGFSLDAFMAAQSDGLYFDTTQLDRYFQESTGPTLADDVGEAIGLGLDQRTWGGQTLAQVLAAATELRGTGTLALQGSATAATYDTGTGAGSASRVDFSNQSGVVFSGLSAGKTFALDITAPANLIIRDGSTLFGTALIGTLAGRYTYFVRIADASTAFCLTASAAGGTQAFTVHSVKLVPGNHAVQSSASLRPLRQTGYSVGNNPELYTASWVDKSSGTGSSAFSAPDVTLTTVDGSNRGARENAIPTISGRTYVAELVYESGPNGALNIQLWSASAQTGTQLANANGQSVGYKRLVFTAIGSNTYLFLQGASTGSYTINEFSVKEAASTYLQAKFDGSDDNWLTNYTAGSGANFIVALVDVPASIAAYQVVAGLSGAGTDRFFIGFDQSGKLAGGVGTDSVATILGTTDFRGQQVVIGLTCSGSLVNVFGESAVEYSGAQAGAPSTSIPLRVGSNNASGSALQFFGGSIAKLVAGREFLTLERYLQIRNALLA